jgi:hypothetical protein
VGSQDEHRGWTDTDDADLADFVRASLLVTKLLGPVEADGYDEERIRYRAALTGQMLTLIQDLHAIERAQKGESP